MKLRTFEEYEKAVDRMAELLKIIHPTDEQVEERDQLAEIISEYEAQYEDGI